MAQNQIVPPMISVTGFIVLVVGSMGYMGAISMSDVIACILMVVGITAVIVGMGMMLYQMKRGPIRGGKEMGFIEKLKNAFKKKNKGEAAAAEPAAKKTKGAAANRVAQFNGEGKVADALRFAAEKIDTKVANGMSEKTADIFMAGLKSIEADTADDDAKMIAISQVIGGIVNA